MAPTASVDARLSMTTRPSLPASVLRTHCQSAVQVNPGLHGALGAQKSQFRFTQESPNIAGRRNASPLEHTTIRLLMSWFSAVG